MASGKKSSQNNDDQFYELYLMRHGIAADLESGGSSDDARRPLTPEGKLKLRGIAKGLDRLGVSLDWIVTSPLKRAVETAEIVRDVLAPSAVMDTCEALAPGAVTSQKVISFLSQHPDRTRVILVGHEPSLSELASEWIGSGHAANLAFKKGGCCLISFDESPPKPPGLLSWWLTPRIMRRLGA
jgi:phosphohistidine phosphatase